MPEIDSNGGLSSADAAVAALQADVTQLQTDVATAETDLAAVQTTIDNLNAGDYYTKTETDTLLSAKATTAAVALKADATALASYVPTTRTVTASGLATGGGALSANQTITVPKASGAEAIAGLDDSKAITPYSAELKRVGHPRVHGVIRFNGTAGTIIRASTGFSLTKNAAGRYTITMPDAGTTGYCVSVSFNAALWHRMFKVDNATSSTASATSFDFVTNDAVGAYVDATDICVTVTL